MSKQLTFSAAISVLAMATFAVSSSYEGSIPRIWSETGAAIGIVTPVVSAELPDFPALDYFR